MKRTLKYIIPVFFLIYGIRFPAFSENGPTPLEKESHVNLVVIDAGHGGKDAGAIYGGVKEKDIVLDIALKLGNYISEAFPETKVIYTRSKDVFIPLHQRAEIANKNNADLFISIHANYVGSRSVQGTETFVLGQHRSQDNLEVAKKENSVILLEDDYTTTYEGFDPNSPESYIMFELVQDEYLEQSVALASAIQNEFRESAKRIDRSVKQAGFLVLRQTTMPSVLIETGFISHTSERNYMMSESGRNSLSLAIFRAFKAYKKKVEERSSFNLVTHESVQEVKIPASPPAEPVRQMDNKFNDEVNVYFSVQVAALKSVIDTKPENFLGETKIFSLNSGKICHYFSGKFTSYENAVKEKKRLETKFGDAFVVAIENGELISVKKAMRKM